MITINSLEKTLEIEKLKNRDFVELVESLVQNDGIHYTDSRNTGEKQIKDQGGPGWVENYLTKDTNPFLKTTLKKLDYSASNSYFSLQFVEELRKILGNPNEFNSLSQSEKKKIQQAIDALTQSEFEWSYLSNRTANHPEAIANLFATELAEFERQMSAYMSPPEEDLFQGQRSDVKFFPYKFKVIIKGIGDMMSRKSVIFSEFLKLTDKDLKEIRENFISPRWLFNDLIRVITRNAQNNLFNNEVRKTSRYHEMLSDNALVVIRSNIIGMLRRNISLYIVSNVLDFLKEKKKLDFDVIDQANLFYHILQFKPHVYMRKTTKNVDNSNCGQWWGMVCDVTQRVIVDVEGCGVYKDVLSETLKGHDGTKKTVIRYVLKQALQEVVTNSRPLLRVTIPEKVTNSNLMGFIIPVSLGSNEISNTKNLVKTLQIAQSKRFRINEFYLRLLKTFHNLKPATRIYQYLINDKKFQLPYPLPHELIEVDMDKVEFEDNFLTNSLKSYFFYQLRTQLTQNNLKHENIVQITSCSGISIPEIAGHSKIKKLSDRERSLRFSERHAQSCIETADIFKGFPLYISNMLCARGRLFPKQSLISRTAGKFKHLLEDYTPKKLTLRGFENLLFAYYKPSDSLTEDFSRFLKNNKPSKKHGMKKLFEFFRENPLIFSQTEDPLYFMLLHGEILKSSKNGWKTGVNVEIDQTASGVVFVSLLTRNRNLAKVANLISKEKSCPYTYCMKNFSRFYHDVMEFKSEKVLGFFSENRKVHKYALMCFCYRQTHVGRLSDFLTAWDKDESLGQRSNEDYDTIKEFSYMYLDFLEYLFPNLTQQLKILDDIVTIAVKDSSKITVRSFEGEVLTWSFWKYSTQTRHSFDPINAEFNDYSNIIFSYTDENAATPQNDLNAYRIKFLSYLVHSLDGAIMRHFIKEMSEKHNVVINHLHDCVILHPNAVDDFYALVRKTYTMEKMYTLIDDLVFTQIKSSVSSEAKELIDTKITEFFALGDNFKDEIQNMDERNMYQFEN